MEVTPLQFIQTERMTKPYQNHGERPHHQRRHVPPRQDPTSAAQAPADPRHAVVNVPMRVVLGLPIATSTESAADADHLHRPQERQDPPAAAELRRTRWGPAHPRCREEPTWPPGSRYRGGSSCAG